MKNFKKSNFEFFINCLMKKGKKHKALTIFYKILITLKKINANSTIKKNPYEILYIALNNIIPRLKLIVYFKKHTKFLIPFAVSNYGALSLSTRWLLNSATNRSEKSFFLRVSNELFDAYNYKGLTIKKKNEHNKLIIENKSNLRRFKRY